MTGNDTPTTMAFLRAQHASGTRRWGRACLAVQRTARGFPAIYPTALSAAMAVPESDRVYDPAKVTRGMVAFYDDPNDSNPAGHITGVAGHTKDGAHRLEWSNDVREVGAIDLVRSEFFQTQWGDPFLFAARSLNGFDLDLPGRKPVKKPPVGKKAPNFDRIEKAFEAAIAVHEKRGHTKLVRELKKELRDIQTVRKENSR